MSNVNKGVKRQLSWAAVAVVLLGGAASAEPIPVGVWSQTQSSAGDCPTCEIMVISLTPNIIGLQSSNNWLGFAFYTGSVMSIRVRSNGKLARADRSPRPSSRWSCATLLVSW